MCDIQVLEPVEIGLNKHTASFADEVFILLFIPRIVFKFGKAIVF